MDELAYSSFPNGTYETSEIDLGLDMYKLGFQKALELMENELKQLREFARDCAKNWDCDSDGHKYNTGCRCCEAETLLQQTEWEVTFNPEEKDADGCLILKKL